MPFLTLEDPNAKIRGSRDPLGAQPIWGRFARHVVTNVTGAANSVRGFSILLLGRYYGGRLIEAGKVPRDAALDVLLRMEQLGAYARYVGHGVDSDIRGIERVKAYVEEYSHRPYVDVGPRGRILSDQKVYGLWGLYSVSARQSGLIPEGPVGVTTESQAMIEEVYGPHLRPVEGELLEFLAGNGKRIDTRTGKSPVFGAVCKVLQESFTPAEAEFFSRHLRDAAAPGANGDTSNGRQECFAHLLAKHTDLTDYWSREEALRLAEESESEDEGLARSLRRIIHLEALLAPADALFDHLLTKINQTPEAVANELREYWGPRVPNLDPAAIAELSGEIEEATSRDQTREMLSCHAALQSGKYEEAIRAVLDWNAVVMRGRNSGPWARVADSGRIDVRYRGAERLLPDADELAILWRNQYFVDSLKNITRQLQGVQ